MKVVETIKEMHEFISTIRREGKTIGLVPTMGALHEGHLTLMRQAKKECDVVVASIFVNPTQFGPNEDYEAYPRTWENDKRAAESAGIDMIFHPSPIEMYPEPTKTWVSVEGITDKLCGKSRPIHFRGVATVVTKLFHIVQPDKGFFGQKDAQQVLVLKRMVSDLNLPLEIVMVPIVREADGLALSSRNAYLSLAERRAALVLSKSLGSARKLIGQGETDVSKLKGMVQEQISLEPLAEIEYVEIYSFPELEDINIVTKSALLALAVKFGNTRLIDNTILEVSSCY